jgi:putative addiction module antidote
MTKTVTLRQVGGSIGATIPKEMAERLHLTAGDEVTITETEQGLLLSPYDAELAEALEIAGRTARKYRNALRELAK